MRIKGSLRSIFKPAFARLRFHGKKSVLQQITLAVSMLSIAFFISFSMDLVDFKEQVPRYGLPDFGESGLAETENGVVDFIDQVVGFMGIAVLVLIPLTLVSFYCLSKLRCEECAVFYTRLESLGASRSRRNTIYFVELTALYLAPSVVGSLCGVVIGRQFARGFIRMMASDHFPESSTGVLCAVISLIGFFVAVIFSFTVLYSRGDLISRLKRHNRREIGERHGYRESYTFRNMPVEKRIAKKSFDYYKGQYSRIAAVFAATFYYPVLAFLFLYSFDSMRVTADADPFDNLDTGEIVMIIMSNVGLFCLGIFLALFALGTAQLFYMIKTQSRIREESLFVYKTVGLTDEGGARVKRYEFSSALFKGLLYLLIAVLLTLLIITFIL